MPDESRNIDRLFVRVGAVMVLVGVVLLMNHWSTRQWAGPVIPPVGWIIGFLGVAVLTGAVRNDGSLGVVFLLISSLASVVGALLLTVSLLGILFFTDTGRFEAIGIDVTERGLFGRIVELGKDGVGPTMVGFWIAAIANGFTLAPFVRERFMARRGAQDQPQKKNANAAPSTPKRRCPTCGKKIAVYARACKHCKAILPEAPA